MGRRWILAMLVIGAALGLTACGVVIDSEGAKIGNPRDFAEATHTEWRIEQLIIGRVGQVRGHHGGAGGAKNGAGGAKSLRGNFHSPTDSG